MIITLFIVVLVLGLFLSAQGNTYKNRRTYINLTVVLLTLESGLRGLSVGPDTSNYFHYFNSIKYVSWDAIWHAFIQRYIHWVGDDDIGFLIYNKLISIFTDNFSVFLVISALTFFVPFSRLLLKYTKDFKQLIFIFVLYLALFHMIAMSGVRKEIALGAAIAAFMYYTEKSYVKCGIVVFLGSLIHLSTLLFLLVPFLGFLNLKMLRKIHFVTFFLIPVSLVASSAVIIFMGSVLKMERYSDYGESEAMGGGIVFTFLIELIALFCYIVFRSVDTKKDDFFTKLYIMLPCFTFFAPLITMNGTMIRISQYFHIYIMLLLPYAIDYFFSTKRSIIYIGLCLFLIAMSLSLESIDYKFIWKDSVPIY